MDAESAELGSQDSQSMSQADMKFPKVFMDAKYLGPQLKKEELLNRLKV